MKTRVYKPGEIIIQEGESSRNLFLLTAGVVEVSKKIKNKSIILSEINPPQVFGELAFFTGAPRSATVRAKTDVEVVIFRYEILQDQIAELPTWVKRTIDTLISRVKSCNQRVIELEGEILRQKTK
jgi:CRP-like cAMP-binding protein